MAGAFRYLEPTAPQPDPDVVFSGVPKPEPYSHVPTTGEVRNLSSPTDTFADTIGQQLFDMSPLALGPAAYQTARTLGEGIRDADPGQIAQGAFESVFLGAPGARNLQKAGKIASGARGSEEALQRAQGAWKEGADPRKVWDETGWADGSQFGEHVDGRAPKPVMWYPMPDIEMKNYDPGIQRGSFAARTEGTEDLLTAMPELQGMAWESRINPSLNPEVDDYINRVGGAKTPDGGFFKRQMTITGRTPEEARAYLMHEVQHAADDNLRFSDMNTPDIYGTDAEQIWEALRRDARQAIQATPPGKSPSMNLQDIAGTASAQAANAPNYAGYLNNPVEVKARMAASLYNKGSMDDILTGKFPGDIDPWAPEAFYPVGAPGGSAIGTIGSPVEWRHYKKP